MRVADRYKEPGRPFAGTLANTTSDLSTFLLHPGMYPTNNNSENKLRKVTASRKIRVGKFGMLFTCMATWRKRGLDPTEQLLRVFSG